MRMTDSRGRRIGLCISLLFIAALAAPSAFAERVTMLDVWLDYDRGGHTYLAQDLPFAEATIVVVHPGTSRAATTYLITLDGAPLAVLGAGQHVVWRTAPRILILGMQSRDGLHLTHFLRAEPGGTYYFRTSRQGLGRTTPAEGQALVEVRRPAHVTADCSVGLPPHPLRRAGLTGNVLHDRDGALPRARPAPAGSPRRGTRPS